MVARLTAGSLCRRLVRVTRAAPRAGISRARRSSRHRTRIIVLGASCTAHRTRHTVLKASHAKPSPRTVRSSPGVTSGTDTRTSGLHSIPCKYAERGGSQASRRDHRTSVAVAESSSETHGKDYLMRRAEAPLDSGSTRYSVMLPLYAIPRCHSEMPLQNVLPHKPRLGFANHKPRILGCKSRTCEYPHLPRLQGPGLPLSQNAW